MKALFMFGALLLHTAVYAMPVEKEVDILHQFLEFVYDENMSNANPNWELYTDVITNIAARENFLEQTTDRYILVNKGDYHLRVIDSGEELLRQKVIVGKKSRPTPLLTDTVKFIVINPFWNVPSNLMRKDVIPSILKKPEAEQLDYIHHKGYRFFRGEQELDPSTVDLNNVPNGVRIRQEPGNLNSLGRIKFLFPNKYNVYIHDTPSKRLFKRDKRELSSGCIRLQHPENLAALLLDESPTKVVSRINNTSNRDRWIKIDPIPVTVVDWSVWVTPEGQVKY